MQITILNVAIEDVKTAQGGYQKADVAYKDEQGKTSGKKIMSFTNQGVFDTLKRSKAGDVFDVVSKKDDKNFWQWVEVTAAGNAPDPSTETSAGYPPKTTANPTPRNTYETPEERTEKQRLIVRQSSLSNALDFSKNIKALKSMEELLATAERFAAFVHATAPKQMGNPVDMPNDTDGII